MLTAALLSVETLISSSGSEELEAGFSGYSCEDV